MCGADRELLRKYAVGRVFWFRLITGALSSSARTVGLAPLDTSSGSLYAASTLKSVVRADRIGPTVAGMSLWYSATNRVTVYSTSSSITMSARWSMLWGRELL